MFAATDVSFRSQSRMATYGTMAEADQKAYKNKW